MKSKSASCILKPKFGLFSYIGGNGRKPTERIKRKTKSPKLRRIKTIFRKPEVFSKTGFIAVNCEHQETDKATELRPRNTSPIFEIHNKIFKPPGSVKEKLISYPYLPDGKYRQRRSSIIGKKPKNFLLTHPKEIFSTFDYPPARSSPLPDIVGRSKSKANKDQGSVSFMTAVHSSTYFNPDSSIYGYPETEKNPSDCYLSSTKHESVDQSFLKLRENRFKPIAKSQSSVFSNYEYMCESQFPPKRKKIVLACIHKKEFKPPTSVFTVVSPEIIVNPINLKREFHLR